MVGSKFIEQYKKKKGNKHDRLIAHNPLSNKANVKQTIELIHTVGSHCLGFSAMINTYMRSYKSNHPKKYEMGKLHQLMQEHLI